MLKSKKQTRCYPVRMGAVGFFIQKFCPRILTKTICKISYLPTKFFRLFTHIIHKLIDKCYSDLFHLGFWGLGDFADKDISCEVNLSFCFGIKHNYLLGLSFLICFSKSESIF